MTHRRPIQIVYEDDSLIIVNKRSGMLSVPAQQEKSNNLVFILNKQMQEKKMQFKAMPCHRLDKETSGVIVFAKGRKVQQLVMDQFRQRKIKKIISGRTRPTRPLPRGLRWSRIAACWPRWPGWSWAL